MTHYRNLGRFTIGDKVLVRSDSNLGNFVDTIRSLFMQSDTLGNVYQAAVLTEHSWAALSSCELVERSL